MNYEIEDNLDWKSLLNISDNNTNNDINNNTNNNTNNNINNDNICLISYKPLTDAFITLPCSHKFNYEPLYNEIIKQKRFNSFEVNRLKINQIKCPYCRTIYDYLLPYYKNNNIHKVYGINSPEKFAFKLNTCEYIYKSGKKKNCKCVKNAFFTKMGYLCNEHNKNNLINNDNNDINYSKLTIPQLKEILRNNNCKVGGNKTALIERILSEKNKNLDLWKN